MKTGTIESIFDKISKKSNKPYFSLKVDGEYYSYWNTLPSDVMVGSTIEFDFTESNFNGKTFKNMSKIKVISGGANEVLGKIGKLDDVMTPIGNLYAMCEEKLNGIIEQNALIETQLKNQTDLLMRVAQKLGVDLGFQKASDGRTE